MSSARAPNAAGIETYSYASPGSAAASCIGWDLPRLDAAGQPIFPEVCLPAAPPPADVEQRLAEETRRSFATGRERGIEEGRAAERAAHAPLEKHLSEELRLMLDDLARERDRYFQSVEFEVVRLALAVAARILRREAQTDPLLLLGAMRVALGQLASATEVRLHVPAADADLWKESIALLPNPPVRPVVIAESAMHLGECRLETSLGHANLSLDAQLDEIERALFSRGGASSRLLAAAVSQP